MVLLSQVQRILIVILFFVGILLIITSFEYGGLLLKTRGNYRKCFLDNIDTSFLYKMGFIRLNEFELEFQNRTNAKNIFFADTHCNHSDLLNAADLNPGFACAIEAAAKNNPNYKVFVIFTRPKYYDTRIQNSLIDTLHSYPNIHLNNLYLRAATIRTPAEKWFQQGILMDSKYIGRHTSDFIRLLLLSRWGGIFIDSNVIILRDLDELPKNFVGVKNQFFLGNHVLGFQRGESIWVDDVLDNFMEKFNKNVFGMNRHNPITRTTILNWATNDFDEMIKTSPHFGLSVVNKSTFYNIDFYMWETNIIHDYDLLQLKNSYGFLTYFDQTNRSIYKTQLGEFISQHCPRIYAAAANMSWAHTPYDEMVDVPKPKKRSKR